MHDITPEELMSLFHEVSTLHNITWTKGILNTLRTAGYSVKRDVAVVKHVSTNERMERLHVLDDVLRGHIRAYHVLDDPTITDAEYDALMAELVELENLTGFKNVGSPTERVGAIPDMTRAITAHAAPMKSLRNVHSAAELEKFMQGNALKINAAAVDDKPILYVVEPKFDGLAVALSYVNCTFVCAATRGDGIVGEYISENIAKIPSVPKIIYSDSNAFPRDIEIRGEVVLLKEAFIRINNERRDAGLKEYANPRNAAAGMVRRGDLSTSAAKDLAFLVHGYFCVGHFFHSYMNFIACARSVGFNPAAIAVVDNSTSAEYEVQEMLTNRALRAYDIDGVVFKINDTQQSDLADNAFATNRFPGSAVAYKFPPDAAKTTVLDIVVQVGRTGVLTPVARLAPVKVGGVMISSANLHNEAYVNLKDIRINDLVVVKRAADVIPEIDRVIHHQPGSSYWEMPFNCPCCGGKVVKEKDVVDVYCPNTWLQCSDQRQAGLEHFVSRDAMNIQGVGPELIKTLIESGHVTDPSQFYTLNETVLATDLRLGKKTAANIIHAIKVSTKTTLSRFLFALGIRGVGQITAEDIAKKYGTFDAVYNAVLEGKVADVPGVGGVTRTSLFDFFYSTTNMVTVRALLEDMVFIGENLVVGTMTGRKVVFTGTFPPPYRRELITMVKNAGGLVPEKLTESASYLVVGVSPSSKVAAAKRYGIPMITQEQLIDMIAGL